MKRFIYILLFVYSFSSVSAQTFKYYYSNSAKFLKSNNDTLLYPFTGGMNAPQFSNIDLNNDGMNDLVVFDRSPLSWGHKLTTFIWDGTKMVYAPQFEGVFPEFTDWVKMIDYNGDGKADIFTEVSNELYQLADTSQYLYPNSLRVFLNKSDASGNLKFKLINNQIRDTGGWWKDFGAPRPAGQVGFSKGDINGIDDIEGDGDIDLIGYNGFDYSPHFYENWTINPHNISYSHDSLVYIYRDDCWGYIQFDINSGINKFKLRQSKDSLGSCMYQLYEKQKHAGSSTLFIDLNGDGIKDFLYGDVSYTNLIALYNDRLHNSLHHDSVSSQDLLFPSNTTPANFIYQPAAYYVDINNDNKKELLCTTNNGVSVKSVNNVWVYTNSSTTSTPVFNYQGNNNFPLYQETIDLGTRSSPVLIDIDKDGDKDLIIATNGDFAQTQNFNDRLILYKNISTDIKPIYVLADTNFLSLSKDTPVLNLQPTFGDLNNDGKQDMIIGDANGYLLYYVNQSSGTTFSFQLQSRRYANISVRGSAAPQLVDMNKDSLLDLVIGNKLGYVQYYQNTGTKTSPQFSSVPTIDFWGGISVNKIALKANGLNDSSMTGFATPHVCDLDNDGKYEMIVGSESGYLFLYTNISLTPGAIFSRTILEVLDGGYAFVNENTNPKRINFGPRIVPFVGNLDVDERPDIIVGNLRGGLNLFSSVNQHLGIKNLQNENAGSITLYPNPANNFITINTENINENMQYEVFDAVGKSLTKGIMNKYYSSQTLSTSNYVEGLYFIVFKGDSGYSGSKRFLIAK